jgi:hypothetical protein
MSDSAIVNTQGPPGPVAVSADEANGATLGSDGLIFVAASSGGGGASAQRFDVSGDFTVPEGVGMVYLTMSGAGGGGASGNSLGSNNAHGGGGGNGGQLVVRYPVPVTPLGVIGVVVGVGGLGGIAVADSANHIPGGNGGDSSFWTAAALGGAGATSRLGTDVRARAASGTWSKNATGSDGTIENISSLPPDGVALPGQDNFAHAGGLGGTSVGSSCSGSGGGGGAGIEGDGGAGGWGALDFNPPKQVGDPGLPATGAGAGGGGGSGQRVDDEGAFAGNGGDGFAGFVLVEW